MTSYIYYNLFLDLGLQSLPTHRPWLLPHHSVQGPVVTNGPEIVAETVKPTPTISRATVSSRIAISIPHLSYRDHQNHHEDSRTQTRDQLFLIRLRNRYRQVQVVGFGVYII